MRVTLVNNRELEKIKAVTANVRMAEAMGPATKQRMKAEAGQRGCDTRKQAMQWSGQERSLSKCRRQARADVEQQAHRIKGHGDGIVDFGSLCACELSLYCGDMFFETELWCTFNQ